MIIGFLRRWYNASKRVLELEAQLKPIAPPKEQQVITYEELEAFIRGVCWNALVYLGGYFYKATTKSEFKRFVREEKAYEMSYGKEQVERDGRIEQAPDCLHFTRKLRGRMVCPGWWWQPALDCWFEAVTIFGSFTHSELLTVLIDDEDKERPIRVYLIEPQEAELFELAREMFEEDARPWLVKD